MSRRSTIVAVAVVVAVIALTVLLWFGGHALWREILALHHRS